MYLLSSVSLITNAYGDRTDLQVNAIDSKLISSLSPKELLLSDLEICLNGNLVVDDFKKKLTNYYVDHDKYAPDERKFFKDLEDILLKRRGRSDKSEKNINDAYNAIKEVNEELNRQIIKEALNNGTVGQSRRNVLKRILALIQLGYKTNTYKKDDVGLNEESIKSASPDSVNSKSKFSKGFQNKVYATTCEFATSALAHGETVVLELPYSMTQKQFLQLIGADRLDEGESSPRVSSHGVNTNGNDMATESKGFINSAETIVTAGIQYFKKMIPVDLSYLPFLRNLHFQWGLDIPINKYNPDDTTSARGHILFGFQKKHGRSVAIVKLETAGPGQTSVYGDTHDIKAQSSIMTATGNYREFNPYERRFALNCDFTKFDIRKLLDVVSECEKISDVSDLTGTEANFLKKHESFVKNNRLDHSFNIPGVNIYRWQGSLQIPFLGSVPTVTMFRYEFANSRAFERWYWGINNENSGKAKDQIEKEIESIWSLSGKWLYTSSISDITSDMANECFGTDNICQLPKRFQEELLPLKDRFTAHGHKNNKEWPQHIINVKNKESMELILDSEIIESNDSEKIESDDEFSFDQDLNEDDEGVFVLEDRSEKEPVFDQDLNKEKSKDILKSKNEDELLGKQSDVENKKVDEFVSIQESSEKEDENEVISLESDQSIDGIEIHRYKEPGWSSRTQYKFIIIDEGQFRAWCNARQVSEEDINKIMEFKNKMMYEDSLLSDFTIQNLPGHFKTVFSRIKKNFSDNNYKNLPGWQEVMDHELDHIQKNPSSPTSI